MLNYWVCTPSCSRETIIDRQDAIQELMKNHPLLEDIRTLLGTLPDLERLLVQIHSFGNAKRKKNHPDGRAVMFEQKIYNKKKIQVNKINISEAVYNFICIINRISLVHYVVSKHC